LAVIASAALATPIIAEVDFENLQSNANLQGKTLEGITFNSKYRLTVEGGWLNKVFSPAGNDDDFTLTWCHDCVTGFEMDIFSDNTKEIPFKAAFYDETNNLVGSVNGLTSPFKKTLWHLAFESEVAFTKLRFNDLAECQNIKFDNITLRGQCPTPNPVPEPSTMLLLGTGLGGLAIFGTKRRKGILPA
jgi:hypothetical protein